MTVTARQLVGREDELEAIAGLFDVSEQLPAAAVLAGEAGIGKTTLWLAGIDAAAARGFRILSCRPSQAETQFSFGGLADLLSSAADDCLPALPPIQRRALEAALLLGESETYADDRAVAAAFLGALRLLAADTPICVAVDDVQWLDAASLAALRYALARWDPEPVAALLAVRGDVPEWLRRAVPEGRLRTVDVAGLSLGATHQLLRTRLDVTFPRPTLVRLWETSHGNPFFALELASALQRRGGVLTAGEELPIPSDLDELVRARIDGLGPSALEVARAVAVLANPTVTLLEAALGARFDAGLTETLDARILERDGDRVRFTHPLLGSAVAVGQTPARRRSLHARLADVVPSIEERARHLALATAQPDADTASTLEEAARAAQMRGAPAAAAELAEESLRLTPAWSADDARQRIFIAADMHIRAGDTPRAIALFEQALAAAAPGSERAAALARLVWAAVSLPSALALYSEALSEAEGDDALQASIHCDLVRMMIWHGGDAERALEHAELAVRAASRVADAELRCLALSEYGSARVAAGFGIANDTMEEALSLERSLGGPRLEGGPTMRLGEQLLWCADVTRARELFDELLSAASAQSDPYADSVVLYYLGFTEWRAGNWMEAERYAADSVDLAAQIGWLEPQDEFPAAVVAAHQGRIEEACARAQAAFARAEVEGLRTARSQHGWVLGFIELSLGDAEAALVHLRPAYELANDLMLEPAQRLELGDLLEAVIAVGELDEADDVLAAWEPRAARLDRAWALAILARCRGLLLAARGDLEGAFACFEHALAEHARSTDPFHHARTLLALGRTQRRAKQRRAARATLEDALARFDQLGAPLWAEQARAELARIGGRAPSGDELTEAERRIATLVGEGRTNREVAAALFLTEHSVETALTRVYRKLDVRSRSELAHRLTAKT